MKCYLPHSVVLIVAEWPGTITYKVAMFDRVLHEDEEFEDHTLDELRKLLRGTGTDWEEFCDATLFAFRRIMDAPRKYYLPKPPPKDPLRLTAYVKQPTAYGPGRFSELGRRRGHEGAFKRVGSS